MKKSESFIRVLVDCTDKDAYRKIKAEHKLAGVPTVQVLGPDGARLDEIVGASTAATFLKKFDAALAAAGAPKTGVAPSSGRQDERMKRILDRIDKEMVEAEKRLRADVERIVRAELEKAGVAKTGQPKDPPREGPADLDKQIEAMVPRMSDAGVTGKLKKYLATPEGKQFVKDALSEQGIENLEEAMEMYFEKDKDGKYTVKEEFEDQLQQMLEQLEPGEAPKEQPKEPPKAGKPGWLGIVPEALSDQERKELGLDVGAGMRLDEIRKGSPAEKAGLKVGDVLVTIGGKKVVESAMPDIMASFKAGETVELTILRDKKKQTVKVTFAERP